MTARRTRHAGVTMTVGFLTPSGAPQAWCYRVLCQTRPALRVGCPREAKGSMVEHLGRTGGARDRRDDEAISGVRENPLPVHLRALERRHEAGEAHEPLESLVDAPLLRLGARVLARFDRLSRDDHDAVFEAARSRLEGVPRPLGDARIGHAVLRRPSPSSCGAGSSRSTPRPPSRAGARRRRAAGGGARRARAQASSSRCARSTTPPPRTRWARSCSAPPSPSRCAGTRRTRTSPAPGGRICEGTALGAWCGDWRAGHRFVCGPPPFALWEAGRAYMDACSGRDGQGGEAFDAWVKAHEGHNAWFSEWKKQSSRAARRWRDLARGPRRLRGAAVRGPRGAGAGLRRPRHRSLGDPGQARAAVLARAARRRQPAGAPGARRLARLPPRARLSPAAEAAFRAFERDAALADVASVELEHAYRSLLAAAERQTGAGLHARDAFRALIDAGDEA